MYIIRKNAQQIVKKMTCEFRHKRKCKDGDECFYYQNNLCEFNHDNENKVVSENEQLRKEIENLKQNLKKYILNWIKRTRVMKN